MNVIEKEAHENLVIMYRDLGRDVDSLNDKLKRCDLVISELQGKCDSYKEAFRIAIQFLADKE